MTQQRDRLCIAILALGGQGGGVLAEWIQTVARSQGRLAQGTSVPGVAQRTGSTVYYVELTPMPAEGPAPVLAQMPTPGDVDVVIASELMEVGRAMVRGFVTQDRTVLIGSTHRIYAISEKSAMSDGRADSGKILEAATRRAQRFVGFDMEAASVRSGSVISSIMFGALAGSGALPFPRKAYEDAIRASGVAVDSNLAGFASGFEAARKPVAVPEEPVAPQPEPTTPYGHTLKARIRARLPNIAHRNALFGVQRLMDYQDRAYAALYLERLERIAAQDSAPHILTTEVAAMLALWMAYDDTIRVADLKTRATRSSRVRNEVRVKTDQLLSVTEFMHPRLQEICETLPAPLGRRLLRSKVAQRMLAPLFSRGRHVETTKLRWFVTLSLLAAFRPLRRGTLRYEQEQQRIDDWLKQIVAFTPAQPDLALEFARCQRLIKGYGETFERGLSNYAKIRAFAQSGAPSTNDLVELRRAALADDRGETLEAALGRLSTMT
jgi:indolepyruvate ferredoxin oxidoreductase beta subunit